MFCIIYSSVEFITLSPPKILSSKSTDCGSAITVEWSAPPITGPGVNFIFGYELTLRSASGKSRWNYSVPREVMSYTFIGLQINTVYEFNIRAKYSDGSSSVSHWAKEVLITTSGKLGNHI